MEEGKDEKVIRCSLRPPAQDGLSSSVAPCTDGAATVCAQNEGEEADAEQTIEAMVFVTVDLWC